MQKRDAEIGIGHWSDMNAKGRWRKRVRNRMSWMQSEQNEDANEHRKTKTGHLAGLKGVGGGGEEGKGCESD
jgi:hypothetical protein